MITLSTLSNPDRPTKKIQRVGRGFGSHRGKTCGRGSKGDGSRRGYTRRFGTEGGQMPLYRKLPCRGFTNAPFKSVVYSVNFALINRIFNDGEVVSYETLREKGYAPRRAPGGLKILGGTDLNKKVKIQARAFSAGAEEYLKSNGFEFSVVA